MMRAGWLVLAVAAGCGGDDEPAGLRADIVDCSADDAVCDAIEDARCSVRIDAIDEAGEVVGICGGGPADRRACTVSCETDDECPAGWTCVPPVHCPGEVAVHYCIPAVTTLGDQGIEDCRAEASPRVCGF